MEKEKQTTPQERLSDEELMQLYVELSNERFKVFLELLDRGLINKQFIINEIGSDGSTQ